MEFWNESTEVDLKTEYGNTPLAERQKLESTVKRRKKIGKEFEDFPNMEKAKDGLEEVLWQNFSADDVKLQRDVYPKIDN